MPGFVFNIRFLRAAPARFFHFPFGWGPSSLMSRSATLDKLRHSVPVIAPSMLKCDFGNLHRELELLDTAGTDVYHLDVMDGNFVPNLSYGPMVIERLRPRTDGRDNPGTFLRRWIVRPFPAVG